MQMYAVLSTLFCSTKFTEWGRLGEKMREGNKPGSRVERQPRTAALMETVESSISYIFIKYVTTLVLLQHLNQKVLSWVVLK